MKFLDTVVSTEMSQTVRVKFSSMTWLHRNSCLRLHAALLSLWLSLLLSTVSRAQPPAPAEAATTSQTSVPAAPAPVTVRGPCDPDYWIVSSRCCQQELECNQPCQHVVYRFDGSQNGRVSSLNELHASTQPGVPVCFMVHGSFVTFESMLRDSAGTYRWLRQAAPDRPVQIVFYTWPSDEAFKILPNTVNLHAARCLGRRAALNSLYLAELISHVPDDHPICLIGHSHGARMVAATLHLLAGGMVQGRCFSGGPYANHRIRAVLAAAAIDHDWFNPGELYDRALGQAEAVINLKNRRDFPLVFHPTHKLFATRALGRVGVTSSDQCRLGPTGSRIVDCEVAGVIGCGHVWPHYYRQPGIACAIKDYVYFDN